VLDGLGEITIEVDWSRFSKDECQRDTSEYPTLEDTTIDEKDKELIGTSHRVLLGGSVLTENLPSIFTTTVINKYPQLKFNFRYANKDILMAKDIMPRPPRPQPRGKSIQAIVLPDSDPEETMPISRRTGEEKKRKHGATGKEDGDGDDGRGNDEKMTVEEKRLLLKLFKLCPLLAIGSQTLSQMTSPSLSTSNHCR